jgi:hypothetical protein
MLQPSLLPVVVAFPAVVVPPSVLPETTAPPL